MFDTLFIDAFCTMDQIGGELETPYMVQQLYRNQAYCRVPVNITLFYPN